MYQLWTSEDEIIFVWISKNIGLKLLTGILFLNLLTDIQWICNTCNRHESFPLKTEYNRSIYLNQKYLWRCLCYQIFQSKHLTEDVRYLYVVLGVILTQTLLFIVLPEEKPCMWSKEQIWMQLRHHMNSLGGTFSHLVCWCSWLSLNAISEQTVCTSCYWWATPYKTCFSSICKEW